MSGKGNITVNGKALDEYFGEETLKVIVRQPLTVTDTLDKFDVICTVKGGGFSGQAGAIRHGIARALNEANLEYRPALKSNGFLTRDSRAKERKKYGLKKARKSSTILKEIILFKIYYTFALCKGVFSIKNMKIIKKCLTNNTKCSTINNVQEEAIHFSP